MQRTAPLLLLALALLASHAPLAAQADLAEEGELEAEPSPIAEDEEAPPDAAEAPADAEPSAAEGGDAAAAESGEQLELRAGIELGIGAAKRGVELPSGLDGLQRLDTDYYPALELGVHGTLPLSNRFALGLGLRYQTSFGLEVEEAPAGRIGRVTPLRSHQVQFGVLAELRLTESEQAGRLSLLAGWAVRGLRSVTELSIPPFTLHGPLVRATVEVPLAENFALRVSPEAMLIVGVSRDLRSQASVRGGGYGVGIELGAILYVQPWLGFELAYRSANLSADTLRARAFGDSERFVLLRTLLNY